jgi:hypothetical protein
MNIKTCGTVAAPFVRRLWNASKLTDYPSTSAPHTAAGESGAELTGTSICHTGIPHHVQDQYRTHATCTHRCVQLFILSGFFWSIM